MTYTEYVPIIIAAFITSVLLVIMTPVAHFLGLVDVPDYRKQHRETVPLTGGLAMFVGVVFGSLAADVVFKNNPMFLTAAAMIVLLGMLDDRFDLSAKGRLFCQFIVAAIMVWIADNYIYNLGAILGFGIGDVHLPILGYMFTMVCVVGVINAFNMIDGIDGLAGGMSLIVLLCVVFLLLNAGATNSLIAPLTIIAVLVPFLAFNLSIKGFKSNKIFMGDAGSMFIGLAIVWLLVEHTNSVDASIRPITAVWLIGLPLMDMAAIMYRRARKGQSMLKADRQHLHNIFMRAGLSPFKSLIGLLFLGSLFAIVGILSEVYQVSESLMFYSFLVLQVIYTAIIMHIWKILRFVRRLGLL
ncbi:UDP-N-acetylglucosamine--undecaprenyl-phosphate N-acetylglucosaminephosphotransferase [Ningiella sp. W23]|uniref:UDP-N-acetylglucosamine--undecaprenyl-phosphate N-acetylglucosaminephosphotransferase n=1 Tax=Ningiella sp. W23 TaxID=3023715 RepID=UPI0037580A5E